MKDKPIYKFDGLKKLLEEKGFQVETATSWRKITGLDVLVSHFSTGQLSFNKASDYGIIFKDDSNNKHFGFLYRRVYRLEEWGNPRMHLCQCQTIKNFINKGSLDSDYRFAETDSVKVIDSDNNDRETLVKELPLCSFCAKIMNRQGRFGHVNNSVDFAKLFVNTKKTDRIQNDIFGYTKDWPKISKAYRELKNYTCENCRVQILNGFDLQYLHVHHIDGNKENNSKQNLRCLCVKCHSMVDQLHKRNFSTRAQQIIIQEFIKKYRNAPHKKSIW